ncbi:MAG TPA: AraC family transcriptional regulator, partial [Candidatus Alistipes intestinigallinarum]|nr:AraC family transcriptional regulator [Candidatus Alistipes intestinigallinarum]
ERRSVSQLADAYGFSDPSHLMRFFKQQTGRTCSAYLEDYRRGAGE